MTKSELESKHLSELHALAAEADVPRYRMLRREELIEKLAGGEASAEKPRESRQPRQRRQRGGGGGERKEQAERPQRPQRRERSGSRERPAPTPKAEEQAPPPQPEERSEAPAGGTDRPRRRRRRRFGRRRKGLHLVDLLSSGRQTIVYAETREGCTTMLRQIAAELAGESNGPDPIAVLAAAQTRHVEDAIAQAVRRAESGEEVVVIVDSLTRIGDAFGDAEAAKGLLDASAASLIVVAALERHS
jgi:Rho termination factor, N-terminal domain